jgi:hypothetical protein
VAVRYAQLSGFDTSKVAANAGGSGAFGPGAVGTVYLKNTGPGGEGVLRIDSHGTPTAEWTPLGLGTDTALTVDRLVLSGAGVVAAPAHQMPIVAGNVDVLSGAVLTHQAATAATTYSLLLTVANQLTVDAASRIDVTNKGYLVGYTVGNTPIGAATGGAGGSYGGLGGGSGTNALYGNSQNPLDPGSGAGPGNPNVPGASGGGLIRIMAAAAQIDGSIRANGGDGRGGTGNPAGSGGGILLDVGILAGGGTIAANGGWGSGSSGSGGGGRVAI